MTKRHEPTDILRQTVSLHAAVGTPQSDIARLLEVDEKTLRKHYRNELDLGAIKANAKGGGALYNKAIAGDTTAAIWWSKTRMGWKDESRVTMAGDADNPLKVEGLTPDVASALNDLAAKLSDSTAED